MVEETFHVTWKQFKPHLMVANQNLLQEKHFADVTLVSDDELQVTAHKVVLSACSPLFRNLLLNNPHPHPLLYMRGIKHQQLQAILQFMYSGEARIGQEDIDEFIAVGRELKVKDLSNNSVDVNAKTDDITDLEDKQRQKSETYQVDNLENTDDPYNSTNSDISVTEDIAEEENKNRTQITTKDEANDGFHYCHLCEIKTVSKGSLKMHIESIHDGIRYECGQCDYMATKQGNLKRHRQVKHEDPKYECDSCEYKTTQPEYLEMHTQSRHEGIRYSCDICDYSASRQDTIKAHKKHKHEGVRYTCNGCDYQTAWSKELKRHRETKHKN